MFPYLPQQAASFGTANLHTLLKVTQCYARGLQQLAELNTQTVKTVFEESNSVLKAGSAATPGEFLSWQSSLLAAYPEKAAAYTRHFLTIVRSTEADMLNEAHGQFEQYGAGMREVLDAAAQGEQSAVEGATERLSDIARESTDDFNQSAGSVLDASGRIARASIESGAEGIHAAQEASEAALRPAKAGAKR